MAAGTNTTPTQIRAAGSPASAKITVNQRVRGAGGPLGLASDVVVLPGKTGVWSVADRRVTVQGIPTVSGSSVGVATGPGSSPASMRVIAANARIRSS